MNKEKFIKSARAAIEDADNARQESVHDLATSFLRSSADFDPLALERLGAAGLAAFLDDIGVEIQTGKETKPVHPVSPSKLPGNRKTRQMGWQALRRKEPIWVFRAIGLGLTGGSSITILGALALAITGT